MTKFIGAFIYLLVAGLQFSIVATAPQPFVWDVLQSIGNRILRNPADTLQGSVQDAIESAGTITTTNAQYLQSGVQDALTRSKESLTKTAEALKTVADGKTGALQEVGKEKLGNVISNVQAMYNSVNAFTSNLRSGAQNAAGDRIKAIMQTQADTAARLSEAARNLAGNQITAAAFASAQVNSIEPMMATAKTIVDDEKVLLKTDIELLQQPIEASIKILQNVADDGNLQIVDLKQKVSALNDYVTDVLKNSGTNAQDNVVVKNVVQKLTATLTDVHGAAVRASKIIVSQDNLVLHL